MVDIDIDLITTINWVIAFGLPLLVGLITTKYSRSLAKVLVLAGLNVINSGLGELVRSLQEGTTWSLGTFLFTLMGSLAIAYGAYTNVWKPTGAAAKVQRQGQNEPFEVGAGSEQTSVEAEQPETEPKHRKE